MKKTHYKTIGMIIITLIVVIVITWLFISPKKYSKILPIENVTNILSIKNNLIYYLNGDVLIARQLNSESEDFTVIGKDISLAQSSLGHSKILYIGKVTKDSKINVLDIESNQQTNSPMYDSFFWQIDNLKLVDTNSNGLSSIISDGKIEYSNLPYSDFMSYSNLILGTLIKDNPELVGYRWQIINPPDNSFKQLIINNFTTKPWVVGNYLLYRDNEGILVRVNNKGDSLRLNKRINQSEITNNNSTLQYYVEVNGNNLDINAINLDDGSITKIKTIQVDDKVISLSSGVSQTYENDKVLYILVNNKVMVVDL